MIFLMFIRYRLLCINWLSLVVDGHIFKGHSKFKGTTVFVGEERCFICDNLPFPARLFFVGGSSYHFVSICRNARLMAKVKE